MDTINQSLQYTQDILVGFQATLPPVRDDEVMEGELLELPLSQTGSFHLVINNLRDWIWSVRIVPGTTSVLLVVEVLELFEPLHLGVVEISSIGDEARRRSVGSRHFVWRTVISCLSWQYLDLHLSPTAPTLPLPLVSPIGALLAYQYTHLAPLNLPAI